MAVSNSIRAHDRQPFNDIADGRVRTRKVRVAIEDISQGGCRIRGEAGFAKAGETINLKIGGINAPVGTIAWVDGVIAGVAYTGEMHPAIVEHLCRVQKSSVT